MIEIAPGSILQLEQLAKKFGNLSPKLQAAASEGVGKYLLNVFIKKEIPPYKHVARADAYPEVDGWFSARQRRWFFASLNDGTLRLPYKRRGSVGGGVQSQWQIAGSGMTMVISNMAPAAKYLYDDFGQSRMSHLIGWKTIGETLAKYNKNMNAVAVRAIKTAIKKEGIEVV